MDAVASRGPITPPDKLTLETGSAVLDQADAGSYGNCRAALPGDGASAGCKAGTSLRFRRLAGIAR